jgi:hypothetical protein
VADDSTTLAVVHDAADNLEMALAMFDFECTGTKKKIVL